MRVLVGCTVLFLAAWSPGQEVLTGSGGKVSMTLAKGWKFDAKKLQKGGLEAKRQSYRILSFLAEPAESRNRAYLDLYVVQEAGITLADVLRRELELGVAQKDTTGKLVDKPVPHLVLEAKRNGRDLIFATGYRVEAGRLIKLAIQCLPGTWENVQEPFFAMLASVAIKAPEWPVHPKGRQDTLQKGVLFSLAPDLKKKLLSEVRKCVDEVQKGMAKIHGSIKLSNRRPLRLYINELSADHKRIAEDQRVAKVVAEPGYRRLFTTPLESRGSDQRTQFVGALGVQLLAEIYGRSLPLWFVSGERSVIQYRDMTKKPLPSVDKAVLDSLRVSKTLAQLAEIKQDNSLEFRHECFLYVALLHRGGKDYEAAYAAFLKDWKKSKDAAAAAKKHLLALDQSRMRGDAEALIKKLRGVKVRR